MEEGNLNYGFIKTQIFQTEYVIWCMHIWIWKTGKVWEYKRWKEKRHTLDGVAIIIVSFSIKIETL